MDHFERSGLRFPVIEQGPADGEIIVALHGFPQDAGSFDAVLPALTGAGFRILVPTQRGYAGTARPARRRDYRMTELVADVLGLLDTAGSDGTRAERVHLVGHDWGGAVAWAMAGWYPDRLRSLTVLSTPHPAALTASLVRSSQAAKSWYMGFFQLPRVPELVLPRRLAAGLRDSGLPAAAANRYSSAMTDRGALTGALNWYRAMPWNYGKPVPAVTVPTTYLWGEHDFALGRYAAVATEQHVTGDYRFVAVPDGHWLPETSPTVVAQEILRRAQDVG